MACSYTVRCWQCGEKLVVVDEYPKPVLDATGRPIAEQPRPYDPDWVIDRHIRRTHPRR